MMTFFQSLCLLFILLLCNCAEGNNSQNTTLLTTIKKISTPSPPVMPKRERIGFKKITKPKLGGFNMDFPDASDITSQLSNDFEPFIFESEYLKKRKNLKENPTTFTTPLTTTTISSSTTKMLFSSLSTIAPNMNTIKGLQKYFKNKLGKKIKFGSNDFWAENNDLIDHKSITTATLVENVKPLTITAKMIESTTQSTVSTTDERTKQYSSSKTLFQTSPTPEIIPIETTVEQLSIPKKLKVNEGLNQTNSLSKTNTIVNQKDIKTNSVLENEKLSNIKRDKLSFTTTISTNTKTTTKSIKMTTESVDISDTLSEDLISTNTENIDQSSSSFTTEELETPTESEDSVSITDEIMTESNTIETLKHLLFTLKSSIDYKKLEFTTNPNYDYEMDNITHTVTQNSQFSTEENFDENNAKLSTVYYPNETTEYNEVKNQVNFTSKNKINSNISELSLRNVFKDSMTSVNTSKNNNNRTIIPRIYSSTAHMKTVLNSSSTLSVLTKNLIALTEEYRLEKTKLHDRKNNFTYISANKTNKTIETNDYDYENDVSTDHYLTTVLSQFNDQILKETDNDVINTEEDNSNDSSFDTTDSSSLKNFISIMTKKLTSNSTESTTIETAEKKSTVFPKTATNNNLSSNKELNQTESYNENDTQITTENDYQTTNNPEVNLLVSILGKIIAKTKSHANHTFEYGETPKDFRNNKANNTHELFQNIIKSLPFNDSKDHLTPSEKNKVKHMIDQNLLKNETKISSLQTLKIDNVVKSSKHEKNKNLNKNLTKSSTNITTSAPELISLNEKYDNSTVKSIKYDEQTLPFIQNITTNKQNKGEVNPIVKSDLNFMSIANTMKKMAEEIETKSQIIDNEQNNSTRKKKDKTDLLIDVNRDEERKKLVNLRVYDFKIYDFSFNDGSNFQIKDTNQQTDRKNIKFLK